MRTSMLLAGLLAVLAGPAAASAPAAVHCGQTSPRSRGWQGVIVHLSVRSLFTWLLVIAVAATVASPAAARSGRPARTHAVQKALNRVVAAGAPGAIALAAGPKGVKVWVAGYARLRARKRMRPGDRFRIGGVTRTIEATVALQLVGDGVLSLDDTVERWLPGKVPNGAAITIRQLLGQRSGLFDFEVNPDWLGPYSTGQRPPDYEWTPDQLLALSTPFPEAFAPGSRFGYSHTNFLVLRMVIEAAAGEPLPSLLQRRISAPLGLHATSVDDISGIAGRAAHGYMVDRVRGVPQVRGLTDATPLNLSLLWGVSDISSTARDLARFFRALVGGTLLRPDLLDAMLDSPSGPHFGLGIQRHGSPGPCGLLYGYGSGLPGYATTASTTRTGRFSMLMINRSDLLPTPGGIKRDRAAGVALTAAGKVACHL
jgi:D-alanyl-D-alanine carboxypeptidase